MDGMWDAETGLSAEAVRQRFAWARRQGRPAWLWPGVPIESWRAALVSIEEATTTILVDGATARLNGEAEPLGLAGYTSGMGPLLGFWAEQGRLRAPAPIMAELARHLAHNRRRAARMQAACVDIVARLAAHGIAAIVLKGVHTGKVYFPEPGTRPASDVDLLVAPVETASAEAVLAQNGFFLQTRRPWESSWCRPEACGAPRSLNFAHADDPWSVDLHSALKITAGGGTALADFDLAAPMASQGVLDQPLLLLHLAAHAGAGWQNLTLLRLVELVLVIRRDGAQGCLDWGECLDVGRRVAALGYAYPALHLAEHLVPGTIPEPVLAACAAQAPRAVRRLLERLRPAAAQRIERNSLAEHFMWAEGFRGRMRLLAADLLPAASTWPQAMRIYEERAWRLIRGTLSP